MKKLLIGLLVLGSVSAVADVLGTPDEDKVVADLRSRFETATEPEREYLLQHSFRCKEMRATRGNFKKRDLLDLRFEEFDGFLIAYQDKSTMNNILYAFNGNELIAATKYKNRLVYDAYRVDSKGFLISEYSHTQSTQPELTPLSASKGKVISYTLCIPKL